MKYWYGMLFGCGLVVVTDSNPCAPHPPLSRDQKISSEILAVVLWPMTIGMIAGEWVDQMEYGPCPVPRKRSDG